MNIKTSTTDLSNPRVFVQDHRYEIYVPYDWDEDGSVWSADKQYFTPDEILSCLGPDVAIHIIDTW